eukprot:TRINITY_DN8793_c0_g1_i1.p2 TRINITY_DN8793_c0_g1~~TRINITY_DN8793_c0_g1_i1.p2  ORF type:complete len:209 (+),score=20.23 TRINITY_DN8793_c0_g1_i1:655-1281(+)
MSRTSATLDSGTRRGFDWLGVNDTDEYWIASKLYNSSITPNEPSIGEDKVLCLNDYLSHYSNEGAVVFPWRMLSSVGTPFHAYDAVILEQYTREYPETRPTVKSFYNLRFVEIIATPHHARDFSDGKVAVNIEHKKEGAIMQHHSSKNYLEYAYLRHYWGMSLMDNIYFKVCGSSWERRRFRAARIEIFVKMFEEADAAPLAIHVPQG